MSGAAVSGQDRNQRYLGKLRNIAEAARALVASCDTSRSTELQALLRAAVERYNPERGRSLLSHQDSEELRRRYEGGDRPATLAPAFGLTRRQVCAMAVNRGWLTPEPRRRSRAPLLAPEQRLDARRRLLGGEPPDALAASLGLTLKQLQAMARNHKWHRVQAPAAPTIAPDELVDDAPPAPEMPVVSVARQPAADEHFGRAEHAERAKLGQVEVSPGVAAYWWREQAAREKVQPGPQVTVGQINAKRAALSLPPFVLVRR